jgi:hypothetical protein
MRDMIPIQIWWFILDLNTRTILHKNPDASLDPAIAARIHDAGGVLSETDYFAEEGATGYELLPEDTAWIRGLGWTPPPEHTRQDPL